MYKVIGTTKSRGFRVMWMLEELGIAYDYVPCGPRSEEAMKYNPLGKIPALVDGDDVLTDSVAIMTYLADKHGALTAPAGTVARAQQDAMTHRILDEFDACLWAAARNSFVLPEEHRVPAIKDTLRWEFARSEAALVRDMGDGPFLMGNEISIPDILLTHCLGWAITAKFGVSEPILSAYLDRMKARPAYQASRTKAA
jgi:glutathione S-transferase